MMKKFLWIVPFCFFVAGYLILSHYFTQPTLVVPNLLGKQLIDAQTVTSNLNINIRTLKHTFDEDLPDGTILHQQPMAGSIIKKNQSIFCVISRKPPAIYAPRVIGKKENEIIAECKKIGITVIVHPIAHHTPTGTCCAQWPLPDQLLNPKTVHIYCSQQPDHLVVMPSLCNYHLNDIIKLLEEQTLKYNILQAHSMVAASKELVVIDQRPQPGSIIDLTKPPLIQLYVSSI